MAADNQNCRSRNLVSGACHSSSLGCRLARTFLGSPEALLSVDLKAPSLFSFPGFGVVLGPPRLYQSPLQVVKRCPKLSGCGRGTQSSHPADVILDGRHTFPLFGAEKGITGLQTLPASLATASWCTRGAQVVVSNIDVDGILLADVSISWSLPCPPRPRTPSLGHSWSNASSPGSFCGCRCLGHIVA